MMADALAAVSGTFVAYDVLTGTKATETQVRVSTGDCSLGLAGQEVGDDGTVIGGGRTHM